MIRTLWAGGVLALVLLLAALGGPALGLATLWPVVLAAAVGLAASDGHVGRAGAFVVGVLTGWLALAVRAGFLPDVALGRAGVALLAVAIVTGVALASAGRVPLWASLVGLAAFSAAYEPVYADSPTTFLADSPVAAATLLLGAGLGFLVSGLMAATPSASPSAVDTTVEGGAR